MTPQELKNSILQLAIQGKLVEQRPEEGTGEKLYRQIQAEKQKLIREGKIKKEKPLPDITEDAVPFDIPESWKWVYIGDLFQHNTGKALNGSAQNGTPLEYITTSNVYWNRFELSNLKTMHFTENEIEKCTVRKGDLLVLEGGEIGRAAIWDFDFPMRIQNHIHRLRSFSAVVTEYFYYIFVLYKSNGMVNGKGIAIQGLSANALHALKVPLPPLAEQKRIVAKIEELLPLIDRYEKAWSRLEEFNKRFPADMQKSLLQMAIQGKLVEQRPEEGTGEELYRQIQAEKQRLIREGKIKKEKPLPDITEDEKPFDIPESWKWVKLGDVSWSLDAGKSPNCIKQPVSGKQWGVITTTAIQAGVFNDDENKTLPDGFDIKAGMQIRTGDVLLTRAGPTSRTGVACMVKNIRFNLILSDKTLRINMTNKNIYKEFFVIVLNSPPIRQQVIELMSGMDKQQVNISQEKYKNLLTPLPPLAEQKRTVAKLEQLLPFCERLKRE